VHAGWRVLKLAGIQPDGFVAPAYAYTPALRRTLSDRFRWWLSRNGTRRRAVTYEGACRHLRRRRSQSSWISVSELHP
jgi:hypothetical protein